MRRIGLTGGIGAGKSTIASVLEKMGYPVFYSDDQAKQLYNQNQTLKHQLLHLFGEEIYQNGQLNTVFLSKQLFTQPQLKAQISSMVHPLVRAAFDIWASNQTAPLVFNEAAILFETGAYQHFDATLLVVAPLELRISRVKQRDGLTEEQVEARIANQWTDTQKMSLTPYVIHNDGRPLLIQIESVLQALHQEV